MTMTKMLIVALMTAALSMGCSKKKETATEAKTESKTSATDKKTAEKPAEKPAEKKDTPTASGSDELGSDIAECVDYEKKLTKCEVLAKTAPSLLEGVKKVWKLKNYSKTEIKDDCVKKIAALPKPCRE
jgi:hypothetical protein